MIDASSAWFSSFTRSEWFDLISTVVGTVALVAAIWIAIHEHRRAVGADRKRETDFKATVRTLVATLNALASNVEAAEVTGETQQPWEDWGRAALDVRRALEAVIPSAPPRPRVITAVASMVRRLEQSEQFRGLAWDPRAHANHARAVRTDLAAALVLLDAESL